MSIHRWIRDEIQVDFDIPPILQGLIQEAEEADEAGNPEYYPIADMIDVFCKGLVDTGYYTEHQWDVICSKYSVNA